VDQTAEDGDGVTPLMAAAMKGHVDVVKALLKAGAYTLSLFSSTRAVSGTKSHPKHPLITPDT